MYIQTAMAQCARAIIPHLLLAHYRAVIVVLSCRPSVVICIPLHCTVLYCTVLYCIVLHCTALPALHCTALYCVTLYCKCNACNAQHSTALQNWVKKVLVQSPFYHTKVNIHRCLSNFRLMS